MNRIEQCKNLISSLKNGNKIHIKKANHGKFTDYCGGKVTSACIARGKASSNPTIRKRATFAANARKWKHENGGIISMQRGYNMPQIIDYSAFNPKNKHVFQYVDKQLHNNGYDYYPRLAILSSIDRESKGNPLAENGPWQGLLQWNDDRYRFNSQDSTEELSNQVMHLLHELRNSGWNGNKELQKKFLTAENIQDANDSFVDGFIRPKNRELEKEIRYTTAIKGLTNNRGRYIPYDSSLNGIPGKFQKGGLVYKPFTNEIEVGLDFKDYNRFPVEPVSNYNPVSKTEYQSESTEESIDEVQEPVVQQVATQIDNTRIEKPKVEEPKIGPGKIYKSSEKEEFKKDIYNAYLSALKNKGFDENKASQFAKRLATQDILESRWGQSTLSKDFNFGGIKDFSGNGIVKDTTEYIAGKKQTLKQSFRQFKNIDDYVNYKINLVGNKWKVFNSNPENYYSLIVSGKQKYATDPNYTSKLNNLYKQLWG